MEKATTAIEQHQKLRPAEVARLFRVSPEKVMTWIRNGELPAINVSTRPGSLRPRYLIDQKDIAVFEMRRQVVPPPPRTTRRNRSPPPVKQFV